MKKSIISLVAAAGILAITAGNVMADGGKSNMSPNANYKHNIPTSEGHKFKDNFGKSEKESFNRNYKQQNMEQGTVKFKDHFSNIEKTNHSSYKHPQGL
jgi:hypothetical protein